MLKLAPAVLLILINNGCGGGDDPPRVPCTPRPVIVELFGDSTQVAQYNGGSLQRALDARFGAGAVTVTSEAVSGTTSQQWSGNVAADVAIFNWGINDELYGTPLAQYRANVIAFAMARATVILETPNPVTETWGSPVYAQTMREVAASTGTRLADVDQYVQSLPNWQAMLGDKVHPNSVLYVLIARDVLMPAITPAIAKLRCQ